MDRILRPIFELPVASSEQDRDLITPRAGKHHIELVIVIKVVDGQGAGLLTHLHLNLISKRAVAVAEQLNEIVLLDMLVVIRSVIWSRLKSAVVTVVGFLPTG